MDHIVTIALVDASVRGALEIPVFPGNQLVGKDTRE